MVHKGVTTQWVGTAIDALQHPRRWNIWLLTRSQNSLALPSPYLAAARADGGFGQNKHTLGTQHFPTLKEACAACALETSSNVSARRSWWWCRQEGWVQRAVETNRGGTQGYCYTWMENISPWAGSEGPLLVKQLHMPWFPQVLCNPHIFIWLVKEYLKTRKHWDEATL